MVAARWVVSSGFSLSLLHPSGVQLFFLIVGPAERQSSTKPRGWGSAVPLLTTQATLRLFSSVTDQHLASSGQPTQPALHKAWTGRFLRLSHYSFQFLPFRAPPTVGSGPLPRLNLIPQHIWQLSSHNAVWMRHMLLKRAQSWPSFIFL